MKKHILGLLISSVSLSAWAATSTIEVSAFYHEDAGFDASKEVVGFYRSLEQMNTLMSAKGIDAEFQPTYVGTITSSDMASTTDVFDGRVYMSGLSSSVQSKTDVGDVALGIFVQSSTVAGNSQVTTDATYVEKPNSTRKIAIAGGYGLGRDGGKSGTVLTVGHELFHAIGAVHESSQTVVFNSYGTSRTDGFANTCDNGYISLIGASSVFTDISNISIAGAADCMGSGNVVGFVNQYAPATASIAASRNNRTLTVSAVENENTQSFDVTVTRTSTSSAETIQLFIAGGYSDTGVGLTPISLSFPASTSSVTTAVLFDDIYPAFEAAGGTENSTYAVAIGEAEVSTSAYDLLSANTLWTTSVDENTSTTEGSGGGGGGSLGFVVLPILALLGGLRRKRTV